LRLSERVMLKLDMFYLLSCSILSNTGASKEEREEDITKIISSHETRNEGINLLSTLENDVYL